VLSFFENYIYATCARVGGGYAIGHDKDIYLIDDEGNPLGTLSGHD
jgi:phospholipase A-2-activating protein